MLREILEKKFHIEVNSWKREDADRAMRALESFESAEDFFEESGWGRDNPELQSEQYLTENHICRWVDGKFLYFSRLLWDIQEVD